MQIKMQNLFSGLKDGTSNDQLIKSIDNNRAFQLLNEVTVRSPVIFLSSY
jgi:hypothetical protein